MLHARWESTWRRTPSEVALTDLGLGRSWTFRELAMAAEAFTLPPGDWSFPSGNGVAFLLTVLAAWRTARPLCPLEPQQSVPPLPPPPPDCSQLKFTSGSTGRPRGIHFTASQLATDADQIVATMGLRVEWPNLGVLSLAHSYGFSNLVTPLLLHGIPLVLLPGPLPEQIQRAALGHSGITLPAVPALWRAWQAAGAIPPVTRCAISAGAPLPLALEQAVFAQSGLKLHNFYGSSECGGIAYDATEVPRTDESRVGTPLRGVELQVGPGGCLEVRGAGVGSGYWPEPEPALAGGCFRTADLAEIGPDGAVRITGRVADQINVAGRKLAPEAVERVLREHPEVRECLVFGVPAPDDPRGELVVACLELGTGGLAAVREHAVGRLPAWQVPRDWRVVASLATGNRGKLSRTAWREWYQAQPRPG